MTAFDGFPQVLLRFADTSPNDLQLIRVAVAKHRVLLHADVGRHPTYPLLALRFIIFDDPLRPYIAEALADVRNGDVQDFSSVLVKMREGQLHIYEGMNGNTTRVASGFFTLRMSAFDLADVRWPYRATEKEVHVFVASLLEAAEHLQQIPSAQQDFEAAVRYHMQTVSIDGQPLSREVTAP